MSDLLLSDKYKIFLKTQAPVEFLEGTTYAGKTTVGAIKFLLMVAKSRKKQHIISGLDTGTIEKNILNKELGVLDIFQGLVEYNPNGKGTESLPHLVFKTPSGSKIIYILGYDNRARWKKALGGQYGCLYIDEINVADMEYVREASMRCDYLMATLNPDNPELPIYKEYINHARPLPQYATDGPPELLGMLNESPKKGWLWWYFSFDHNAGLSEEKKKQIISNVPAGTKIYKNKILGLRGKTTGLVFSNFDRQRHLISEDAAKSLIKKNKQQKEWFVKFSAGLDTAYSSESPDTIAMTYIGITNLGRCILLEEKVYNNAMLSEPIAPSDTVVNYIAFLDRCRGKWGACRDVFIDSADQATITEFKKYKRQHGSLYNFTPAWKQMKIVDRINLQLGWYAKDLFKIVDTCKVYTSEMESYCWKEDKDLVPEDANDHLINSTQYAWIPYTHVIGGKE
jgi:PBSX family phage terminase large subunit